MNYATASAAQITQRASDIGAARRREQEHHGELALNVAAFNSEIAILTLAIEAVCAQRDWLARRLSDVNAEPAEEDGFTTHKVELAECSAWAVLQHDEGEISLYDIVVNGASVAAFELDPEVAARIEREALADLGRHDMTPAELSDDMRLAA